MSSISARRLEEKERRREQILEAAERVAAAAGFGAMTMDEVAREARLSRALLYVYFHDKSDLGFAICHRGLLALHDRFATVAARAAPGRDRLTDIGRAYVAFSREAPVHFEALTQFASHAPESADPESNEGACIATGDRLHALMVECIEAGQRDGSVRTDIGPPLLVALTLWGFMHGVLQLATTKASLIEHDGFDAAALVEHALFLATRAVAESG